MDFDIRSLRLKRELRQRDVARTLGVSGHQMRMWERGLDLPSQREFAVLAGLFGVDVVKLVSAQEVYCRRATPGEGYTTAKVDRREVIPARCQPPRSKLRVLDLFCGCGGLSFGLEWTGHFVTVCGVDLLPDRIQSFLENHPYACGVVGDICSIDADAIRDAAGPIDVVVGGPPCQGFSSIRPFRTLTEGDKRNSLVEHFVARVGSLRPHWFLFENVVGVLTHRRGEMLDSLLQGFQDAGYKVSWRVLNAARFGVPQNRERLVVIGNCLGIDFLWPEPTHRLEHKSMAGARREVIRTDPLFSQHLSDAVLVSEAIGDLVPVDAGCEDNRYVGPPQNKYQRLMRVVASDLTLHRATKHSKKMLEIIRHAGPNRSSIPEHLITSGFSSCYSRLDADRPSTTLTVNFVHPASNRCVHPAQNRALTIREGARLQSFPDHFRFCGTVAQIVKQIGNAVPPLVAKKLGDAIYEADLSLSHNSIYRRNARSASR